MPSVWSRGAGVVVIVGVIAAGLALVTGQQFVAGYLDAARHLETPETSSQPAELRSAAPAQSTTVSPAPALSETPSPAAAETPAPASPQASPSPAPLTLGDKLSHLLGEVAVIPERPNPPGYDRDCSPGSGCVFGTEWNDATDAPDSRNGCDTRNDVLRRDLVDTTIDPGTNGCVVRRGVLHDPYTGRRIQFERGWGSSLAVQIDHLIPLAAAWDLGAWQWSPARRATFANDTKYELLAVDGPTNMAKVDGTPASWLPPNKAFRCEYGVRYIEASLYWQLPITAADAEVLTHVARTCR